jgi:hypothetical protein
MDKIITPVIVGLMTSCIVCGIVLNQIPKVEECVVLMKDQYGHTHQYKGAAR